MKKITVAVLLALASLAHADELALGVTVKGIKSPAVDLIILEKNALGLREVKGWRTVEIEHMPWLDESCRAGRRGRVLERRHHSDDVVHADDQLLIVENGAKQGASAPFFISALVDRAATSTKGTKND